ncbi:hypothetical protein [Salidesulfovibrio brasiliensis]|uniref:hypothetical protein n=1 Tax=Salidesulfovibrio brasiliensis TaxID=221711 RepID=UPI000B2F9CF8|nr:hypothetical protein [Salidesulfovibrio brasiliensis]
MKKFVPLLMLAALALSGCGKDWVNPNIADPRKEDQIFQEDSKICHKFAKEHNPQMNELGMQEPEYSDELARDEFDYTENKAAYSYWEKCMRARGWITSKEYYGD